MWSPSSHPSKGDLPATIGSTPGNWDLSNLAVQLCCCSEQWNITRPMRKSASGSLKMVACSFGRVCPPWYVPWDLVRCSSEAHSKSFLVSWPEVPSSGKCSKMVSVLVGLIPMQLYCCVKPGWKLFQVHLFNNGTNSWGAKALPDRQFPGS